MTAEIITPNFETRLDVPIERILEAAAKGDLDTIVIIGRTKEGDLYFASSTPDGPEILWLIENARGYLLSPDRD